MRALRVRVWESIFTKDMLSYQQWMHESVGRFPTLILGPTGSGKEIVAEQSVYPGLFLMTLKVGNLHPIPIKVFVRSICQL